MCFGKLWNLVGTPGAPEGKMSEEDEMIGESKEFWLFSDDYTDGEKVMVYVDSVGFEMSKKGTKIPVLHLRLSDDRTCKLSGFSMVNADGKGKKLEYYKDCELALTASNKKWIVAIVRFPGAGKSNLS